MDSTLHHYRGRAASNKGGSNADDITPILDDVLLGPPNSRRRGDTFVETTGVDWSRDNAALRKRPDLIVIHFSAFEPRGPAFACKKCNERFYEFIAQALKRNISIIIYSRGDICSDSMKKQIVAGLTFGTGAAGLPSPIMLLQINNRSQMGFQEADARRAVMKLVETIIARNDREMAQRVQIGEHILCRADP